MTTPRENLFNVLTDLNIPTNTVAHPPLFTVSESKQLRGNIQGGHTKNLFLKDKQKNYWLLSALEDTKIDLKSLAKAIHAKNFSFAKPEALMEKLKITPGSVSPFALINNADKDVCVILDKSFENTKNLNFHPLENTATTNISYKDLLQFLEHIGHKVLIHDFNRSNKNEI